MNFIIAQWVGIITTVVALLSVQFKRVELILINSAEFPISCIEITIICQDVFDNTIIREVVSGVIDRKSISTIKLGMEAGYAGKVNFRIEEAKLYKGIILIVDEILAVGDMLFQRKCHEKMAMMMKSWIR